MSVFLSFLFNRLSVLFLLVFHKKKLYDIWETVKPMRLIFFRKIYIGKQLNDPKLVTLSNHQLIPLDNHLSRFIDISYIDSFTVTKFYFGLHQNLAGLYFVCYIKTRINWCVHTVVINIKTMLKTKQKCISYFLVFSYSR